MIVEPCTRCSDCERCRPIVASVHNSATGESTGLCRMCWERATEEQVDIQNGIG